MPLLLGQKDLQPLLASDTFYPDLFAVIQDSLLRQHDDDPGVVSWLAFPTARPGHQINLHLLSTPVEGTSIRVFPHRVGEQAKDSMFTLLFDDEDGHLLALLALDDFGPLRTSAPVAFACRYLAPKDARTLALLGSGLQARYHLLGARHAVPSLREVRVFSPTPANRGRFAGEMRTETSLRVDAVASAREALAGADIVMVTAPAGREPLFAAGDVRPGALVTTISAWAMPPELRERARIAVPALVGPDHHASGWDPFPFRLNGGRPPETVSVTLVDVLRGARQPREREDETVLYEQSGSFAWDGAMVRWVYDWAQRQHAGQQFHISA